MILGPISYLDCIVFCVFLAPQLLIHVGLFETVGVALQCLPFLLLKLPYEFIRERFFADPSKQSPFVQVASPFEDFVIRCVRYAFANVPPKVGRVFFSKPVALPFLRFRMLRHGFLRKPVHWREHVDKRFKGIWVTKDPTKKPDVCIYYAHGGGFSMGSSYFYLEFLLAWLTLLGDSGFSNPAVFALEYTLVPDDTFPKQMHEAIAGYDHVVSMVGDASKICVSGDSAGATVLLSLLLHIADRGCDREKMDESSAWKLPKPGMAAFISPWVTLVSNRRKNTASDYLDAGSLHQYAREYVGKQSRADDPLISPGNCRDLSWWKRACPAGGMFFAYGAEEVFAPEIENLLKFLEKNKIHVASREEPGGIHAWPVAALFLASSTEDRQRGLRSIVRYVKDNIPS
ncbi:Alpha/Beta hydrolase protein [Truncatella angustata]|uniref:Alpha/Beta hydrolase protein n=1 Tax=Truncatella angustata TaxID=152316 RepID=A0A9P8UL67_9PEZI|nr:Alpha/Beta hydrolase protein [Truncatella angustata]KAH6654580.1 Alpha/Beta hydrolase protein [Truncatella angustata]